jgi:tyrosine aminotransferase
MEAIVRAVLRKPHTASYTHACGALDARRAIAAHHSVPGHPPLDPEHVIVTNGCSGALELALASLLDPGTSLLVPQPGFPLYEEIAESNGASVVKYRLDPNRNWECDMNHLEEILNENKNHEIRAMVINNPSSYGAVFSEKHLLELLDFALKHRLLIVSDEVYGDLTFGDNEFHPLAVVAGAMHGSRVPVIITSGLSKQFLVPGWRIGWATFHDNVWGSLHDIEVGAQKLANLKHGAVSHLQQSVIPTLLSPNTKGLASWKECFRATLEHQARFLCSELDANCNGLKMVSPPQGSMYTILSLDLDCFSIGKIANDVDFCRELVREENVFVLPGSSFGVPNTIRIAFGAHESILEKASSRIAEFCHRHTRQEVLLLQGGADPQQQHNNETE